MVKVYKLTDTGRKRVKDQTPSNSEDLLNLLYPDRVMNSEQLEASTGIDKYGIVSKMRQYSKQGLVRVVDEPF